MRKISDYIILTLKGTAMGAADVVPGVSGGTIAFIAGIYEELINSIKSIDLKALSLLGRFKFREFWKKINGNFLLSVVLGIGISIFSLAKLMTYLLHNHPIGTWAFFFGLIIASSFLVSKDVNKWNFKTAAALLAGTAAAYAITAVSPASTPDTWWFVMLSGAIAICAMILPGISGAFILVLLGKYQYIMEAVSTLNVFVLLMFVIGAVAGIISFSHFLSWLLAKHRPVTIAVLTGFMVGSLNKVWPWKKMVETYTDSHGNIRPLIENNISPGEFGSIYGDSQLWEAILLCAAGFLLIWGIEKLAAAVAAGKKAPNK